MASEGADLDQPGAPAPGRWIVNQIGAREHYGTAAALHGAGLLSALITDLWAPPGHPLRGLPGSVGQAARARYLPALAGARVQAFNAPMLAAMWQRRRSERWAATMAHNLAFGARAARHLQRSGWIAEAGARPVVLAYSYAAREIFEVAKAAGAITVLGQIDGGEADQDLVRAIAQRQGRQPEPGPPAAYWARWHEECALADRIVVNSTWAGTLLVQAGVAEAKIRIVPVIYQPAADDRPRAYPQQFTQERPLRVLFLGALSARKGVGEALAAARLSVGAPVSFTFIGRDVDGIGARGELPANVHWRGALPRSDVGQAYAAADVFLFPSHSDGFGMVQVEALDHGLPVIASRHCGDVVEHGQNGLVLDAVTGEAIAAALHHCWAAPQDLQAWSRRARPSLERFSADRLLPALLRVVQ